MKKNKKLLESVVEVFTFKEAVVLQYTGHSLRSIDKNNDIDCPYIYRFFLRSDTLALLDDFGEGTIMVEPGCFIDALGNLLEQKERFVGGGKNKKDDNKGLDQII